jgi:hypothetical protein
VVASLFFATAARAASPPDGPSAASDAATPDTSLQDRATQVVPALDEDLLRDPSQPDFALVTLPTTLRVPRGRLVFRLTHRFSRPLGQGDLGELLEDFFGFDSAAQIGLELRYGLMPGTQIGIHRTNDKTIQLFAQQDLLPRQRSRRLGLNALVTLEGLDNLRDEHSVGIGVVVSGRLGDRGAVYAEPIWIGNANLNPGETSADDYSVLLGLGARFHVLPDVYLLGQFTPRLVGHDPGESHAAFGIEKRIGGHTFQLNFSNALGSTVRQVSQGASAIVNNWFIGFNISRKFY